MAQRSSPPPPRRAFPLAEPRSASASAHAEGATATPVTSREGLSTEVLARLGEETHRLTMRFIDEVVIAFDLCPWARPSLLTREVEIRPILLDFREAGGAMLAANQVREELERVHPSAVLALIVLPLLTVTRLEMDALLRAVRTAPSKTPNSSEPNVVTSAQGTGRESEPPFALAAFHPDAPLDLASPARLVPFLRRSPYPLVQAVRTDVLGRIDAGRPSGTETLGGHVVAEVARYRSTGKRPPLSPRDRIAVNNHTRVRAEGPDVIERVLTDIFRDRDETRRRLGIG